MPCSRSGLLLLTSLHSKRFVIVQIQGALPTVVMRLARFLEHRGDLLAICLPERLAHQVEKGDHGPGFVGGHVAG